QLSHVDNLAIGRALVQLVVKQYETRLGQYAAYDQVAREDRIGRGRRVPVRRFVVDPFDRLQVEAIDPRPAFIVSLHFEIARVTRRVGQTKRAVRGLLREPADQTQRRAQRHAAE